MSGLKLFLFGPPRVELNSSAVDIKRRKVMALLIYLVVTGQPHSRDALATLFYPDYSQSRARAYLRRDLAVLNTTLAGDGLDTDRETVEMKGGFWVDVAHFRELMAESQQHDHPAEELCPTCMLLLKEATALYNDDFLTGFSLRDCPGFDDWQFFQAESLRQELATGLERLAQGLSGQGEYDTAIPYTRRWVALDPLHEPAQRRLIQLYDLAGQLSAALRQYEEYVQLLEEELGLPPEEETTTLYEAIKAKRLLRPYLMAEQKRRSGAAKEQAASRPAARPSPRSPAQPPAAHPEARPTPPTLSAAGPVSTKAPGQATPTKTQVVGREVELEQLNALLDTALQGKRQLVFVTGQAGQGKTTLIETFLEQARAGRTLAIGQGYCIEHRGAGEAYMPLLEAFSRLCQEPGGQTLVDLMARVAPTWLLQMPWLISAEAMERLQQKVQASTRDRMLREMLELLEVMTVKQPLVLVLEDLHWSDYSTLDLLAALARRQESACLLIIGTYRLADAKMSGHPLQRLVQGIQILEQGTELPLPSLSEAAVGDYLASRFANATLPAPLAELLYQRTAGNPLFMRAVVDSWVAQGILAEQSGHWTLQAELDGLGMDLPNNLRRLIELQLMRLDAADQNILEVASVIGIEFPAAALAAGLPMTEEEIEAHCEILAQQGQFLHPTSLAEWPDGTVSARFEFSHQLYQEVLYQRVTIGRRVRLHRQLGRRLEQGYGSHAPEKATELALHFVQGRDSARAVTYLRFAAEQAMQRNAYREAIEHLKQALEILARHSDLPDRDQHELALQLILGPALIMTQGWASVEAEQAYIRARELCHAGNTRQLATTLYGLATVYELRGEYAKTQKILEERLRLPRDSQDLRVQLESHELLACSTFHQGVFIEALNHADQALTFCTPGEAESLTPLLGEDPSVSSHHWAGLALWFLGYPDQALARSQTALNEAKNLGYTFGLAHAQEQAAMLHQLRREELVVEERAENTITAATQGGFAYWVGVGKILRGWSLAVQDQTEPGIAQLHEGLEICQRSGATIDHPYFLSLLAEAYGHAGQFTQGLEALAEALALARKSQNFFYEAELHRLRGVLLWQADAAGNLTETEASFQQALAVARSQAARSLELRAAVSLGRLWQKQGRKAEARKLLTEIYSWFSEGFDTPDLQEARSLLAELGAE
jgi:predicted ATPase